MRQLTEAAREFDQPLYTAFIDIAKAYGGVPREALLAVLRGTASVTAHHPPVPQDLCQGPGGIR